MTMTDSRLDGITPEEQRQPIWVDVCALDRLELDRGVCALVGGDAVAVFRVSPDGALFAVSNVDPFTGASVMSRGIVGSKGDIIKVSSPMLKHAFDLCTGEHLDDPTISLRTFAARVSAGRVEVAWPESA